MNKHSQTRYHTASPLVAASLLALMALPAFAQTSHEVVEDAYDDPGTVQAPAYEAMTSAELEELAGPIALYPDDLVSLILPAATYPVQIVQAARFLEDRERDAGLRPPEDWDDAVVALLNYPEVIELMNDDLDWTWTLGEAFLNQQAGLMDAIASFRGQAYAAGNLKSDERQVVTVDHEVIEIEPADPEVIYVPYYEPERVIVYQPYPVYYYHRYPRYSYYYPYPADYSFAFGYFFGVSTAYRLHWHDHRLYTYYHGYRGHPYFGRRYHRGHYFRHRYDRPYRPRQAFSRGGYARDVWKPRPRHGSRPGHGLRSQRTEKRLSDRHVAGENRFTTDRSRKYRPANGARQDRAQVSAFAAPGTRPQSRAVRDRNVSADRQQGTRVQKQRDRRAEQASTPQTRRRLASAGPAQRPHALSAAQGNQGARSENSRVRSSRAVTQAARLSGTRQADTTRVRSSRPAASASRTVAIRQPQRQVRAAAAQVRTRSVVVNRPAAKAAPVQRRVAAAPRSSRPAAARPEAAPAKRNEARSEQRRSSRRKGPDRR